MIKLNLSKGQVIKALWPGWVNFPDDPTQDFISRIDYLRKNGVPFPLDEKSPGSGSRLVYGFDELVELALAVELMFSGMKPKETAWLFNHHRKQFRVMMKKAYEERHTKEDVVKIGDFSGDDWSVVQGYFLEITTTSVADTLRTHRPRLLSAREASMQLFRLGRKKTTCHIIAISKLLDRVVKRATEQPEIPLGRPGKSNVKG